ncbi:transporter [Spongiibacter marinus]|uniref:transporter n=1 Tax=Spongiibacter marinus TaxID=354246 RepID=UPI003C5A0108
MSRSTLCTALLSAAVLSSTPVFAHDDIVQVASMGAAAHGPIGVMGDHTHKAGEWMFSYRYMAMEMEGNLGGGDSLSAREITGTMMNPGPYMVAPLSMDMEMHMFGAMYAPSDDVTLMFMLPYLSNEMDHQTRMGGSFTTESSGWGDVKASALVTLYTSADNAHRVHANLGLSLPTGSIDERDDTPAMKNAKLPYRMQLGSGSVDLLPGVTYSGQEASLSWGAQLALTIRSDYNDNDYRLGNRAQVSAWLAHSFSPALSASLRVTHSAWGNIDGARDDLNPMMVPTADPDAQGGERSELSLGLNYLFLKGAAKGHRLALEYGEPVYQHLDGPQMELDSTLTAGWQYAF